MILEVGHIRIQPLVHLRILSNPAFPHPMLSMPFSFRCAGSPFAMVCLALLPWSSSPALEPLQPASPPQLPSDFPTSLAPEGSDSTLVADESFRAGLGDDRPTTDPRRGEAPTSFDLDRLQQPRVAGAPRDPLAARRTPQSPVEFKVRAGLEYNDNVFAANVDEESDVIAILAPTLAVHAGDYRRRQATYLSAAYTATGSAYLESTANDTLDHLLEVAGQWNRERITIPFDLRVAQETGAFIDIGGRDTAESYGGRIGIELAASSKLMLGISGEYNATQYRLFANSENFIAEAYFGYTPSRKLTLGGVYRFSDSTVDGADGQSYQAALVRMTAQPTSKLSAFAEAGVAFSSLGKGDRSDLIYRVGVAYQPSSKRRFTAEAVRRPSTSSFTAGSGFINNGVQLGYEQALGSRTRVVFSGGYELQDYFAADEGTTIDRQDNFFAFSSLLAYDFSSDWQAQFYYTYSNNDSSDPFVEFDNQKVGMGLTWTY